MTTLPAVRTSPLQALIPAKSSPYHHDARELGAFLDARGGLTPDTLQAYYQHVAHDRGGKSWTASTAARKLAGAKSCIRRMLDSSTEVTVGQRYQIESALKALKPPSVASRAIGANKVITRAEERALLKALDRPTASLVRFLLATGARISEALGIREGDVKPVGEYNEIRLRGKGNKERIVFYRGPEIDFAHLGDRTTITNRIRRASRRAIGRTVSAHCMRHSFATRMLAKGADLTAVSKYLGHADISVTSAFYAHTHLEWKDVK